jgi:RNA recognition motif-containing protein
MDVFRKFGVITCIEIIHPCQINRPSFAFITFENSQDAQNAIHEYHGTMINQRRIKVDFKK